MSANPLHGVAIVGVHNTAQARSLAGETAESVTFEAIFGALADAKVRVSDVDGLNVTRGSGYPVPARNHVMDSYELLGPAPCWLGVSPFGVDAVVEAATAVAAGLCHTVVIANGQAGAYAAGSGATAPWTRPNLEFTDCWGLYTAVEFALLARRHMHLFGTLPEHLAEVASTIRTNGNRNPGATMAGRGDVTPQDVLDSRMIAEPFHLFDCSLTTEGGAAVVLTTTERARDLPGTPVYLLGAGVEHRGRGYARPALWEEWGWVGERAARQAFAAAGCTATDVDVAELYDPFSFEVIHQLEAYGFCPKGEGGPFVMDGRIRPGGELPVCTDGGLLSFGHNGQAQMLQRVIAGVLQLRGQAGVAQVADAEVAFVGNNAMASRSTLVLGREPAS